MAQYKVPQDVEADDKLLGPFSFRQFVYLLIAAGLIAVAVGLWQIFPLLAIIPLPLALFFIALALPLRKDQPTETYLAAIVSYYLKPRKRIWTPGQRESTIQITAPKIVEASRTRDITGEEATHRLSFLADIVDTEGFAIKGPESSLMRDDLVAEANMANDMFDNNRFNNIGSAIVKEENVRHEEIIKGMRAAIEQSESIMNDAAPTIQKHYEEIGDKNLNAGVGQSPNFDSAVVVAPEQPVVASEDSGTEKQSQKTSSHSIMELANNPDFSVATIAKEAKRINEREKGEVFISLH